MKRGIILPKNKVSKESFRAILVKQTEWINGEKM